MTAGVGLADASGRDGGAATVLRWAACLAFVMGVHVAASVVLLRRAAPPELPAAAPEAILLDLAPEPAPPVPEPAPTMPEPQAEPAVPPTPPVSGPEPAPLPVEPTPEAVPPDPMPVEPAPTPAIPEPIPAPPELPVPEAALPLPPAPVPAPAPRRVPPRPALPRATASRPAPDARQPVSVEATASSAVPAPATAPLAPPAPSASQAPAWQGMLLGRLQRAKRYPDGARGRREEGVASLTFSMSRDGQVLSARIARSSGSEELDAEALAMVRRAEPLPAPPADVPGNPITLTVPVRFSLR